MMDGDVAYWEGVSSKTADHEKSHIRFFDNFIKKRKIIRLMLQYDFTDEKILEVGVGNGLIAHLLKQIYGGVGFSYRGADIAPHFIKTAKSFFNLDVQEGRITDLPFDDGEFTVLWLFDVLEHIHPEERQAAYIELDRVMDKKKRMIFINNPLSPSNHNEDFDYGFRDKDLAEFGAKLNLVISDVEIIKSRKAFYQNIVMALYMPSDRTGVKCA